MGKFVICITNTGTRFDLRASNGAVIATSAFYASLDACKNGVASVAKTAASAAVEDQTQARFKVESTPKFEIFQNSAGEFCFRLNAENGQVIAVSECYEALDGCKAAIALVKKTAPEALIEVESN